MDTGILHTHHLLGVILLVLIGAPLILPAWIEKLRKVHMAIDTLLLLTGLYLIFKAPAALSSPYLVKYGLVILAIGLAIVGSRKRKKAFSITAFMLLAYAYGLSLQRDFLLRSEEERVQAIGASEVSIQAGQQLYNTLCLRCHGAEGRSRYRKASSLHPIQNPDTTYWAAVIRGGKNAMPAHPYLTDSQVASLIAFLRSWQ
ncbi:MAG: cytochrome c [Bacteroidia bacterium]|nr:cytochrome c [Bacteroidia bacterium]MDW8134667.1 cytochrome c [Bacteroidia bacterium]